MAPGHFVGIYSGRDEFSYEFFAHYQLQLNFNVIVWLAVGNFSQHSDNAIMLKETLVEFSNVQNWMNCYLTMGRVHRQFQTRTDPHH